MYYKELNNFSLDTSANIAKTRDKQKYQQHDYV